MENRNLFLDLLLHSGSNVGIILLRDLVRENQLDAFTAARLVAYAGAYVKEPSEPLLAEFLTLLDIKLPAGSDPWGVYRNAAVLAVASFIGKTCASGPSTTCQSFRVDEWRQGYFDKVTSTYYMFTLRNYN